MNSKKITLTLLGVLVGLIIGIAGYGYYYRQLEVVVNSEDDQSLGSNKFHVVGSLYGPEDNPFLRPLAVTTFKNKIYIGDSGNSRIVVYSARGRYLQSFGDQGDSRTKLSLPTDIAVDHEGLVWVADRQSGRVMVYDQEGKFVKALPEGTDRSKLNGFSPLSLAFDQEQRLLVFDVNQQRLLLFNRHGKFLRELYRDEQGLVTYVNGLVSSENAIIMANSNVGELVKLQHNKINELKGMPDAKGLMPRGISRHQQTLYISDMYGQRILVYDYKARRVSETLGLGQRKRLFSYPNDVAVDQDERVIVADKGNNRIVIIEPVEE